jgi:hypothetical protein
MELCKPKLDKELDFIFRYSYIINSKLLKFPSSTSSVKGQFFKICSPPGVKGKGKAIPLQAWTGPKVARRLRLPDFNTIGT